MDEVSHGPAARRLLGHAAWLTAGQVVVRLASLLAFPLLTNSVEPKTFGLYLYALQIAVAVAVLANFQLKAPLLGAIAREPSRAGEVVGQALALRGLLALLVLAAASAWAAAHFETRREWWIFELLLAGNLLWALGGTFDEALQAAEGFRASALVAVAQGLTVSGGIIVGVLLGRPIAWAVGAHLAGAMLATLLAARLAGRTFGRPLLRLRWSGSEARAMLKLAGGVAAAAQLGVWYGRVDLILVERYLGATPLGQYGVAYRALDVLMAGVMTLHAALLPMLARAQAAGPAALLPRLTTVLRFGLLLLTPLCLTISLLAPVIITIFKPDYAPGAAPLAVLIWVMLLTYLAAVLHWVLIFHHRPWQPALTMAVALLAHFTLCQVAVPRYGLLAAAASRTFAELLIVVGSALLVQRQVRLPWLRIAGPPGLMALAMLAGWQAWSEGPWPARALLALLAYLLAGGLLRPIEPREWRLLQPASEEAPTLPQT